LKRLFLTTVAALAIASPASADNIDLFAFTPSSSTLTLTPVVPGGNQPRNIPCLICGENQPQQKNFGYNDFGNSGNETTINAFSSGVVRDRLADDQIGTGYSLGAGSVFLAALLGRTDFAVGVDVNDTGTAQTLSSFFFLNLTQHTVLASFTGGADGNIPSFNNGTGFPDYTLTGFDINRGDIRLGDEILFFARITGANDGPDSFFLVPQAAAPVPGPVVGAFGIPGLIACLGMLGLGRWRRKHLEA